MLNYHYQIHNRDGTAKIHRLHLYNQAKLEDISEFVYITVKLKLRVYFGCGFCYCIIRMSDVPEIFMKEVMSEEQTVFEFWMLLTSSVLIQGT